MDWLVCDEIIRYFYSEGVSLSDIVSGGASAFILRPHADQTGERYIYNHQPFVPCHSVEFGRVSGISEADRVYLVTVLNGTEDDDGLRVLDVTKRIHQYYNDPRFYVMSAIESGRTLTGQEWSVYDKWDSHESVPDVSVSHILGSGLVHNMLNRMLLQFRDGERGFGAALVNFIRAQRPAALAQDRLERARSDEARETADRIHHDAVATLAEQARPVVRALAQQVSAMARMRGLGRAIIAEEPAAHGYGEKLPAGSATNEGKRRLMAMDVDIALGNGHFFDRSAERRKSLDEEWPQIAQTRPRSAKRLRARPSIWNWRTRGPADIPKVARQDAYLSYLMHTVDSTGNLRLGSRVGNSNVGAGFDMPLTSGGQPTERGRRLYRALETYGLPDMAECRRVKSCGDEYHTGHFTTDSAGRRISSSQEVSDELNARAVRDLT